MAAQFSIYFRSVIIFSCLKNELKNTEYCGQILEGEKKLYTYSMQEFKLPHNALLHENVVFSVEFSMALKPLREHS
jgi:hypothetical protein